MRGAMQEEPNKELFWQPGRIISGTVVLTLLSLSMFGLFATYNFEPTNIAQISVEILVN